MAYTTINKHTEHFNSKLYTGNGTTDHAITGVGFQPDLNWIKKRSTADNHIIHHVGMNAGDYLRSNSDDALSNSGEMTKSLDSDGFTVGTRGEVNTNNSTFASWNWKANGSGSANSDGTITTTYTSANTTSGFSIIKYSGNATAGATVGHGLNSAPEFVFTKKLSASANWQCWGSVIGNVYTINLNHGTAKTNPNGNYNNDTNPNSTVVTLGNDNDINQNGEPYIMYCFHSVKGYSKIGTYTGTGSAEGAFVYTGFKPAWVMIKRTSDSQGWVIWDNKRPGYNLTNQSLTANESGAEETGRTFDVMSNGFKIRDTNTATNANGSTYMYLAFGQSLVGTNNVPCTAR